MRRSRQDLEEVGVRHLFGVPGDYNLELLHQLQDTGTLKWIGTCSELNASYAADGCARLNGLNALLVTKGVVPLAAINGIDGSYSEHVPVICISGSGMLTIWAGFPNPDNLLVPGLKVRVTSRVAE